MNLTYFGTPNPPAFLPNPVQYHNHYVANVGPFKAIGLRLDSNTQLIPDPVQIGASRGPIAWGAGFTIASIVDGTTNTMLFSEDGQGRFSTADQAIQHLWVAGQPGWGFEARFPPNWAQRHTNPAIDPNDVIVNLSIWDAMSFHPGGINVAFCDGSVRFIKDTIDCWTFSPPESSGLPDGATYAPRSAQPNNYSDYGLNLSPTCRLGVWQKVATRDGGEVVSSDTF